jgi:hypothetical protein
VSGLGALVVGLVLCFVGVKWLPVAVLASGFALGWLLTEPFNASLGVEFVVALAVAVAAWVLATFVFRAALFFVGLITGGVIGAKLFGLLQGNDHNILLGMIFVVAVAFISGIATQRFHKTVLTAMCALGGAGLALSGMARVFPDTLGFLRTPTSTAQTILATVAWLVVAILGWLVQRRLAGDQKVRSG